MFSLMYYVTMRWW